MAAKKEQVDAFEGLCSRADRMAEVYSNSPFWKTLKAGCDAARAGKIDAQLLEDVKKECRSWGPFTSNKRVLLTLLDRLQACEVGDGTEC